MTEGELVELLAAAGSTAQEVGLSDLDHALQCASELAGSHPYDFELQLAGLFHDIGHRFGPDDAHGRLGAECVRPALGDRVAQLVELHVPAKRYLVTTDPSYRWHLSDVSVRTLTVQGGALSGDELAKFASSPHCADALALRRADDAAKVPGRQVPPLEHWARRLQDWSA
jgi:predicted HD phosphohydrolase